MTGCNASADFTFPVDAKAVAGDNVAFQDLSTASSGASSATLVAWHWTFGDGHTADGPQASHTYVAGGQYQVSLTVTDSSGCTGSETKMLTVAWSTADPGPEQGGGAGTPVVHAGDDLTVDEGTSVRLEATGYGAPGATITYQWRQLAGLTVSLQGTDGSVLTFVAPGTGGRDLQLVFGVRVSDGFGASAEDTVIVNVLASNHAPLASAGEDLTVAPGQSFTLSAAASKDLDDDPLSFTWSLVRVQGASAGGVPGLDATGETVQLTAPLEMVGSAFDVQLTATDGLASSADTVRVWIVGAGMAPPSFVARAQPGGAIQFTAMQEADVYAWEFGDGNVTASDARTVSHTYAKAGTYKVVLRLDGAAEGAEQAVTAARDKDQVTLKPGEGGSGTAAWLGIGVAFAAAILVGALLVWALRQRPPAR